MRTHSNDRISKASAIPPPAMAGIPRYQATVTSRLTVSGISDSDPAWSTTSAAVAGIPRNRVKVTVTWHEPPVLEGAPELALPLIRGCPARVIAALGGVVPSQKTAACRQPGAASVNRTVVCHLWGPTCLNTGAGVAGGGPSGVAAAVGEGLGAAPWCATLCRIA
jgi:hypothetical protein